MLDAIGGASSHVCLGTDSRVTGARDLLDEMRAASALMPISPRELMHMVTAAPARILRLRNAGAIAEGAPADMVVIPAGREDPADALLATERRHVLLVTIGGRPVSGAPEFKALFARSRAAAGRIVVDGIERLVDGHLARAIARCPIHEPGVEAVAT
jgi:cytosine/adenosine deaminase-related metal-dependent hydrolase